MQDSADIAAKLSAELLLAKAQLKFSNETRNRRTPCFYDKRLPGKNRPARHTH